MLKNLAVMATSSLVKIALNANLIVLAQTDAVITFFTQIKFAHLVNSSVRPFSHFDIDGLMTSMVFVVREAEKAEAAENAKK